MILAGKSKWLTLCQLCHRTLIVKPVNSSTKLRLSRYCLHRYSAMPKLYFWTWLCFVFLGIDAKYDHDVVMMFWQRVPCDVLMGSACLLFPIMLTSLGEWRMVIGWQLPAVWQLVDNCYQQEADWLTINRKVTGFENKDLGAAKLVDESRFEHRKALLFLMQYTNKWRFISIEN